MSGYAAAGALVERIRGIVGDTAHVTMDPHEIVPQLSAMRPVIAVNPPDVAFTTWTATDMEWEVHVIAGPAADRNAAWETLDALVFTLAEPLAVDTAKTASFDHPAAPSYPAYVLTFTDTY